MKRANFFMLIKVFILVFIIQGTFYHGHSQSYGFEYVYDDAGNRTQRMYINLKSISANLEENTSDTALITDKFFNLECIIHPNPTKGILQIDIPGSDDISKRFSIYSMQGALISDEHHSGTSVIIDLNNQPAGVYILVCQFNNQRKEWKIIKE